tara:strand:+ start:80 stop:229 length:150 start_codon:yes stop_codon:yes gene_type:complete
MKDQCPYCHDDLEGDGYYSRIHCPNVDQDDYAQEAPDSNPIYCNIYEEA